MGKIIIGSIYLKTTSCEDTGEKMFLRPFETPNYFITALLNSKKLGFFFFFLNLFLTWHHIQFLAHSKTDIYKRNKKACSTDT